MLVFGGVSLCCGRSYKKSAASLVKIAKRGAQNNHKVFDSIQNYPNYPKSCKLTKIITQIIKNYPKYNLIITQIIQKCSIYKYNLTEKIKSTPPKTNMEPENSIHFFSTQTLPMAWLFFALL